MAGKVFICGITGTQGGAVAQKLLSSPSPTNDRPSIVINAVVRNASSDAAKHLSTFENVHLWPGDYDDTAALELAIQGCSTLFLNLSPSFTDPKGEQTWANNILQAAKAANVQQVIYSSGMSVDAPERLPYFSKDSFMGKMLLSKQAIERAVRAAGFPAWTILRPGNLMANYLQPLVRMYPGLVENGRYTTAFKKDTILPMADPSTLANFVCAAIADPERFHTHEIEIVDELLILDQVLEKIGRATGRDFVATYMPDEEALAQSATNPFVQGQLAMRDLAIFAKMDKINGYGLPLTSFDGYLNREKKRVQQTYL